MIGKATQSVFFPVDLVLMGYALISLLIVWQQGLALAALFGLAIIRVALFVVLAFAFRAVSTLDPSLYHCIRALYPIPLVVGAYKETQLIIRLVWNGQTQDEMMKIFDERLFGISNLAALTDRIFNPWLATFLQAAYASFLFLPLLVALALAFQSLGNAGRLGAGCQISHREGRIAAAFEPLHYASFILVTAFMLSYFGYLLVPVRGPMFFLAGEYTVNYQDFMLLSSIRELLGYLQGVHWDCFPSGHTLVVIVIIGLRSTLPRKLFAVLCPIGACIVFSTVYLRYHYMVDVVVGVMIGILLCASGPRIFRALMPER